MARPNCQQHDHRNATHRVTAGIWVDVDYHGDRSGPPCDAGALRIAA
jgi:hypothetical protein